MQLASDEYIQTTDCKHFKDIISFNRCSQALKNRIIIIHYHSGYNAKEVRKNMDITTFVVLPKMKIVWIVCRGGSAKIPAEFIGQFKSLLKTHLFNTARTTY